MNDRSEVAVASPGGEIVTVSSSEEVIAASPGINEIKNYIPDEVSNVFDKRISLTPSAKTVLEKRYLMRNEKGEVIETPEDMFRRVAFAIAEGDKIYHPDADIKELAATFYEMMVDRDFIPNSPTLMNAGRQLGQLSACFVLPIGDSISSIFETVKYTALIHKSGGGSGFSFSHLRPKNDVVRTTAGVSSGPVPFMKVFDAATEAIKQGGTRRGANMGILRIDHPDIIEFINCKQDHSVLTNFNISVALTEEFMQAVEQDTEYDLVNPRTGETVDKLRAKEVFDLIVENAWESGEPGIIFLDRINRDNPTPNVGKIESTNPCGEQPLLPYESCNLGSINLSNFVDGNKIEWDRLARTTQNAVHFLDNVVDVNKFPLKEIEENTRANRKIGLGIMGFAEMLFKLRIPYCSDDAVQIAEKVMSFVQSTGEKASVKLAEDRGVFPNFDGSMYDNPDNPIYRRNATVTTIAPTGTISIIAGTSSGIEPLFALAFARNVLTGERLIDVNQVFMKELETHKLSSNRAELVKKILKHGTIAHLDEFPDDMRKIYTVAHDVSPEWHIKIQAAFQRFTDNAVSKTINYSNDATRDNIREGYILAYKLGCKGITVYRDGCRTSQVLTIGTSKEKDKDTVEETDIVRTERNVRNRPPLMQGMTFKISTGCGNLYVTINEDKYGPFEIFSHLGKTGGCAASQSEALSRVISLALRSGIPANAIINQLKGIRCPNPIWDRGKMILSCPDGIAKALEWAVEYHEQRQGQLFPDESSNAEEHLVDTAQVEQSESENKDKGSYVLCPECGSTMYVAEGCATCPACGYSKCS
ncbi:ribonucleotide-diphosphate reductase subunit alpha [bacterium]|nr:MAG: ribonucleotide-diphosphate reductase subunit alpha [bacterium]